MKGTIMDLLIKSDRQRIDNKQKCSSGLAFTVLLLLFTMVLCCFPAYAFSADAQVDSDNTGILGTDCISGGTSLDQNGVATPISIRYEADTSTLYIAARAGMSLKFWEFLPSEDPFVMQQAIISDDNLYYAALCPAILSGSVKCCIITDITDNHQTTYSFTVEKGRLESVDFTFFDENRNASYNYDSEGRVSSYHAVCEEMIYNRLFSYEDGKLISNEISMEKGMVLGDYSRYYYYGANGIESEERVTKAGSENPVYFITDKDGWIKEIQSRDAVFHYSTYLTYYTDGTLSGVRNYTDEDLSSGFTFSFDD